MKLPNFFESLLTEKEKLCESKYSTIFLLSVLAGVLLSSLLVIYGTLGFIADAFMLLSPFSDFSFLHIITFLIFHRTEELSNTAQAIFLITIIHIFLDKIPHTRYLHLYNNMPSVQNQIFLHIMLFFEKCILLIL